MKAPLRLEAKRWARSLAALAVLAIPVLLTLVALAHRWGWL